VDRRRALSALALAALPAVGSAQGTKVRRVGFISFAAAPPFYNAFRAGMADLGYVEGKNVIYHARFGSADQRLEDVAAALVKEQPDLIVAAGGPAVIAVRKVSATAPMVFSFSGDPVVAGIAKSLAQPGNNATGMSLLSLDLVGKRMELLKEAVPQLKSVAILANPDHAGEQFERKAALASANALNLRNIYFQAQSLSELDAALARIATANVEGLVVFPDALAITNRQRIAEAAVKARVAAVSGWGEFVDAGFLMSYGPNLQASYRRLGAFVDKVFKGANPGTLPIELPSVIELVVNTRTAQALKHELPREVVLRADRVVQ
jgi:putative ABC transport system substrate-binding protein